MASLAEPEIAEPVVTTVERHPGFSPWWTLTVLSVLNVFAVVDRGGITLMVNPIKADLGIGDVEMSLLMGFSFTLVSSALLIPTGYMVDLFNRRMLVGWSVVAWSCVSSLTGFAAGFWSLFATRNGLACTEAVLPPAAHSMIRDAFPPEKRGVPFSVYTACLGLGANISLLVSGTLIALGDRGFFHAWPIIGHFKTWQIVLALPGMCTMPLALLMLTVREPARRRSATITVDPVSFRDSVRYVWDHGRIYLPFFIVATFQHVASGGTMWRATALIRGWDLKPADIAHITGTVGLVTGIAGLMVSGWLMDRLSRRGVGDGPLRIAMIGNGISAWCSIAVLHVHAPWAIYTLLGVGQFFGAALASSVAITLAYITPSRLMGRMTALLYLSMSLIGSAPGPTLVALVAKYCYGDQGPNGIIPAINSYTAITQIICMGLLLFTVVRIGQFHRKNPGGAG